MSLFEFMRNWRTNNKIKGLENQLRGHPTPKVYLRLADAYAEAGNSSKAVQVLKLGVARFPSAPEITRRHAEAEKVDREHEKKRLQAKIQTHPNPILYARLAELYKVDNDIEKTIQICQAGIRAFPKYGGTYLVLGQIYAEKQQWDEATKQLEKSVELDKYNYMALKLLSQIYLEVGRFDDAVRRLEEILYFAPGDEAIKELLKKARQSGSATGQPSPDQTATLPRVEEAQRPAAKDSERRSGAAAPPAAPQAAPSSARDQLLLKGVQSLRQIEGVKGAILVDQYGLVVASSLSDWIDESLAGALITNVYRTTSENTGKIGVGDFEEGVIEGEDGNVHIAQIGEMILAVFAQHSAKMGLLQKNIRDFALSLLNNP